MNPIRLNIFQLSSQCKAGAVVDATKKGEFLNQLCQKLGITYNDGKFFRVFRIETSSKLNHPDKVKLFLNHIIYINVILNSKSCEDQSNASAIRELLLEHTKEILQELIDCSTELDSLANCFLTLASHRKYSWSSSSLPSHLQSLYDFLCKRLSPCDKENLLASSQVLCDVGLVDQKHLGGKIGIIGSGPAALMAAVSLHQRFPGKSIEIIDYQTETRDSRFNNIAFHAKDVEVKVTNKSSVNNGFSHGVTIKHLEKVHRRKLANYGNKITIKTVGKKYTTGDVDAMDADIIVVATGASDELPKALGFSYTQRNFRMSSPFEDESLDAMHLNLKIKLTNQNVKKVEKKLVELIKNDGMMFYYYVRKHKSSRNEGTTTFYINQPVIKINDGLDLMKILKDLRIAESNISSSEFQITPTEIQQATEMQLVVHNKTVYVIGDAHRTPYYIFAEGISNARKDIAELLHRLTLRA